jgi:hypothetical protein
VSLISVAGHHLGMASKLSTYKASRVSDVRNGDLRFRVRSGLAVVSVNCASSSSRANFGREVGRMERVQRLSHGSRVHPASIGKAT